MDAVISICPWVRCNFNDERLLISCSLLVDDFDDADHKLVASSTCLFNLSIGICLSPLLIVFAGRPARCLEIMPSGSGDRL